MKIMTIPREVYIVRNQSEMLWSFGPICQPFFCNWTSILNLNNTEIDGPRPLRPVETSGRKHKGLFKSVRKPQINHSIVLWSFRLGAHYLSTAAIVGTEQYFDVTQIIQHENYNSPKRWSNDVALLKLSRPAVLRNGVGLVCLSDDKFQRPFNNKSCWTSGWGTFVWLGSQPKELMQVDLPLVSTQNCSLLYANYDPSTMICAGTRQGGTGACNGDSGGPLVCEFKGKWYLEGVTSWGGVPCASPSKPTVYADVRKLKSWIAAKITSVPVLRGAASK